MMTTNRVRCESRNRPLMFSPVAWLKLQYLCHAGGTEVGGFALTRLDDPLYVDDVLVVRQRCTFATVAFDDAAVADLFDRMTDCGIPPDRFARIWLHTHPDGCTVQSGPDEATFFRVFGRCDWAIMAILGRTGRMSARLQFNVGPHGTVQLKTSIDWSAWPVEADSLSAGLIAQWRHEYETLVDEVPPVLIDSPFRNGGIPLAPALLDFFPGVHS